jgi:tetratricopeptide (TPR) repeat protein
LTNLGNVLFIRQAYEEALSCYLRVDELESDNLRALLGVARTLYELGRFEEAQAYYRRLKTLDPELAGRYAYIALRGSSGERATPTSGLDPKVIWEDE